MLSRKERKKISIMHKNTNKKIIKKKKTIESKKIITAIDEIKLQLEVAREHFKNAVDESLIDSYIYEIISLNKKYDYYLKEAKILGLTHTG